MAKKIIWSINAQDEVKAILEYWRERNRSNIYSHKLNLLFRKSVLLLAEFPKIGKLTDDKITRAKIVKDYIIFYQESAKEILIVSVWDTRRNPNLQK